MLQHHQTVASLPIQVASSQKHNWLLTDETASPSNIPTSQPSTSLDPTNIPTSQPSHDPSEFLCNHDSNARFIDVESEEEGVSVKQWLCFEGFLSTYKGGHKNILHDESDTCVDDETEEAKLTIETNGKAFKASYMSYGNKHLDGTHKQDFRICRIQAKL